MIQFKSPLFIVGYMASGKTTFGRALARESKRDFIDLDFYIEQRFRRPIAEIFARDGEERFRVIERSMLHEVGMFDNTVIACGGGTPCFFDNMDFMLQSGNVVFLEASTPVIVQRIIANNARRPLMAGKSPREIQLAVDDGLSQRMKHYARANIIFNGDSLDDKDQIDQSVRNFIRSFPDLNL